MVEGNMYLFQSCTKEEIRDSLTTLKKGISSIITLLEKAKICKHMAEKIPILTATQTFIEQQLCNVTEAINNEEKLNKAHHLQLCRMSKYIAAHLETKQKLLPLKTSGKKLPNLLSS